MIKNRLLLYQTKFWLLPFIAAAFFLAALALLLILQNREQEIQLAERDSGLWAAYQLDRENLKLNTLLNAYKYQKNTKRWKETELRFEILYSRLTVLRHGQYYNLIEIKTHTRNLSLQASNIIELMDDTFLLPDAQLPKNVTYLLQLSQQLQRTTEELITTLKDVSSQINTKKRQTIRKLYHYLIVLLVFLMLTMALIIYLLIYKMFEARTAQHKAQLMTSELEEAITKSEAANLAKSEFLATMSHEIRTPMNGVLGMSELLFETSLNTEQQKYTHAINKSATALMTLLNELMDISKLEAGRLALEYKSVELKPLLQEVIDFFAADVNHKPITLSLQLDPKLGIFYKTDPGRLRQILLNLVGNAIKFTQQGKVELRASLTESGLFFEVTDTGIGIDESVQKKIFELFIQADTSISRRYEGAGLGLAISRRIIEQMGGSISLRSRLNAGSCFYFTLPLQPINNLSIARKLY